VPQAENTSDVSFDKLTLSRDCSYTVGAQSEEPKPSLPADEIAGSATEELENKLSKQDAIPEKKPMMTAPSRFKEWPGIGTSAKK